jgi:hypothetical protein
VIPSAPFDSPPPPKPKPDADSEPFEPGRDIGPWRILLPVLAFALTDTLLLASFLGLTPRAPMLNAIDDLPVLAAIVASQSLLVAMMYQGSAPTLVRSIRRALAGPSSFVIWGLVVLCGALFVPLLGVLPTLGMAMAGGVFVGLSLDLLGFGLRPIEDIPASSRRFSLKSVFFSTALIALLLVGLRFAIADFDQWRINVFRITLALFLALATLGVAALAAMWSWPTWLGGAAISLLAVVFLAGNKEAAGVPVAIVPVFGLAISAVNALPLLLADWRVYRKPYYG